VLDGAKAHLEVFFYVFTNSDSHDETVHALPISRSRVRAREYLQKKQTTVVIIPTVIKNEKVPTIFTTCIDLRDFFFFFLSIMYRS
jgi:hypothetical protein